MRWLLKHCDYARDGFARVEIVYLLMNEYSTDSSVEESSKGLKDFADNELRAGGRSMAGLASVDMGLSIPSLWLTTSERAPRVLRVRIRLLYGSASAENVYLWLTESSTDSGVGEILNVEPPPELS